METLYRKTFFSWKEGGFTREHGYVTARAVALCDGSWFNTAINVVRDSDMGRLDENGVFERKWYGDDIFNGEVEDLRAANSKEVELYLRYCKLEDDAKEDGREMVAIIKGEYRTDVIFRSAAKK